MNKNVDTNCPICNNGTSLTLNEVPKNMLITATTAAGFVKLHMIERIEVQRWERLGEYPAGWGCTLHMFNGQHRHLMTARGDLKKYSTLDSMHEDLRRICGGEHIPITLVPDWAGIHLEVQ